LLPLRARSPASREVREDGVVGTRFTPAGEGRHPALVVLHGSGGGINKGAQRSP
jgi:poly(3-hydroxybutyrate) depolymerase